MSPRPPRTTRGAAARPQASRTHRPAPGHRPPEKAAPRVERRHPPRTVPSVEEAAEAVASMGRGAAVIASSPALTGAQRRELRGRGHALSAVVHIGTQGLTLALAGQLHEQLESHELIKVRVLETCPESLSTCAMWIHRALEAQVPQILGRTILVWRPSPSA